MVTLPGLIKTKPKNIMLLLSLMYDLIQVVWLAKLYWITSIFLADCSVLLILQVSVHLFCFTFYSDCQH